MTYYDTQQQNPAHNSQFNPQQWAAFNSQAGQPYGAWSSAPSMQAIGGYGHGGYGIGQAAYGQQYGQYGGQPSIGAFGYNAGWGGQPQGWGQQQQPQWGGQQQRQLSQQDVSEVVRQLVPALPQILAQAQQPQHAAFGYAAYGQAPRQLSQQDVNEVVRQILPIVPQIVGMLQNQPQLQYAAMQGGLGLNQQGLGQQGMNQQGLGQQGFGQQGLGQQGSGQQGLNQQGLGQFGQGNPFQNFGGQFGLPQFQSAFGAPAGWGQQQRQLSQQDVADVTRQLIGMIPQVIGNLQAFNQQRMI
jgi:hypothetical protein